jgi:phospholipase A1
MIIKNLFVVFAFAITLFASPVDKQKDEFFNSLQSNDKQTDETIKQIVSSTYNIRAYKTNYFLPLSYRYGGSYQKTYGHIPKNQETEFQFSVRYDITADLFGLNEIYSVSYTQKSFWQLYASSAYFRESIYSPEFFVTFPSLFNSKKYGIKAITFAFTHESNGRGAEEERSWNNISVSSIFQYKYLFTEVKLWTSWKRALFYNKDLLSYLGYGHVKFILPYKKHLFSLKVTTKGSVDADYSYPAFGRDDIFFYIKTHNGYGESLVDYNNRVNKIGFGFSLSR